MKITKNTILAALVVMVLVVPVVALAQINLPSNTGLPSGFLGGNNTVGSVITRIVQIALALAGMIAILFLILGGFRYVTAAGNEEAAESAKKTILNAIIGIIVIILSYVILTVIANALVNNNTGL